MDNHIIDLHPASYDFTSLIDGKGFDDCSSLFRISVPFLDSRGFDLPWSKLLDALGDVVTNVRKNPQFGYRFLLSPEVDCARLVHCLNSLNGTLPFNLLLPHGYDGKVAGNRIILVDSNIDDARSMMNINPLTDTFLVNDIVEVKRMKSSGYRAVLLPVNLSKDALSMMKCCHSANVLVTKHSLPQLKATASLYNTKYLEMSEV